MSNYKILALSDDFNSYMILQNGKFTINLQYEYELKDLLKRKDIEITAVMRTFDKEVFYLDQYVTDEICRPYGPGMYIEKFYIHLDKLQVAVNRGSKHTTMHFDLLKKLDD